MSYWHGVQSQTTIGERGREGASAKDEARLLFSPPSGPLSVSLLSLHAASRVLEGGRKVEMGERGVVEWAEEKGGRENIYGARASKTR